MERKNTKEAGKNEGKLMREEPVLCMRYCSGKVRGRGSWFQPGVCILPRASAQLRAVSVFMLCFLLSDTDSTVLNFFEQIHIFAKGITAELNISLCLTNEESNQQK